ncbi:hypothetical protein D3C72_998210 [compost metagenome]
MSDENSGFSVPWLTVRELRLELLEETRLTVKVYVSVVVPSCAVTSTVITVEPTGKVMEDEAAPLATTVPSTFTVAVLSCTVGVTLRELTELPTFKEYSCVPDETTGDTDPCEVVKLLNRALADAASRVTVTWYDLIVVPSCAVTSTVIGLAPTESAMVPEAVPLGTLALLTLTVACDSFTVGVTVRLVVVYGTSAV